MIQSDTIKHMSDIIWTNHAKERNKQRQITESWVEGTVNNPDSYREIEDGKTESKKKFENYTVTVITAKSKEGKYLILSTWINPPIYGTNDYKKSEYIKEAKKAGPFKKLLLTIVHQLGI